MRGQSWRVGARTGLVDSEDTVGQEWLYRILQELGIYFKSNYGVRLLRSELEKRGVTYPGPHSELVYVLDVYVSTGNNAKMPQHEFKMWDLEVQGDSHQSNHRIERDTLRTLALEAMDIKVIPIPDRELMSKKGRENWKIKLKEEFEV